MGVGLADAASGVVSLPVDVLRVPVVALSDSMNRASSSPARSVKSGPERFIGPPPRRGADSPTMQADPRPLRPEAHRIDFTEIKDDHAVNEDLTSSGGKK